jgi:hypothetical protein
MSSQSAGSDSPGAACRYGQALTASGADNDRCDSSSSSSFEDDDDDDEVKRRRQQAALLGCSGSLRASKAADFWRFSSVQQVVVAVQVFFNVKRWHSTKTAALESTKTTMNVIFVLTKHFSDFFTGPCSMEPGRLGRRSPPATAAASARSVHAVGPHSAAPALSRPLPWPARPGGAAPPPPPPHSHYHALLPPSAQPAAVDPASSWMQHMHMHATTQNEASAQQQQQQQPNEYPKIDPETAHHAAVSSIHSSMYYPHQVGNLTLLVFNLFHFTSVSCSNILC